MSVLKLFSLLFIVYPQNVPVMKIYYYMFIYSLDPFLDRIKL